MRSKIWKFFLIGSIEGLAQKGNRFFILRSHQIARVIDSLNELRTFHIETLQERTATDRKETHKKPNCNKLIKFSFIGRKLSEKKGKWIRSACAVLSNHRRIIQLATFSRNTTWQSRIFRRDYDKTSTETACNLNVPEPREPFASFFHA